MTIEPLGASFRDPSGFVYEQDGTLYRRVHTQYAPHYDRLMQSGLYAALTSRRLLVPHEEVGGRQGEHVHATLRPEPIPYVSYPYEWCFSALKAAALLTLDIQLLSLEHGMVLKDASAYNVQFIGTAPVFIDTLSFEIYREDEPWAAYGQYCRHFLAPLALAAHSDVRCRGLLTRHVDGVPLDLASALLPGRTRLRYGLLAHVHLHAKSQLQHQGPSAGSWKKPRLPRHRLVALVHSLRETVRGCELPLRRTTWSDYYQETNYSADAMAAKEEMVLRLIEQYADPAATIHDLGANTGRFSRLLASRGRYVVAHDFDDIAVERSYRESAAHTPAGVLPLVLDLTNPSPGLGWALEERTSALDRIAGGTVVALALVHHLAIGNNVPLASLARLFARLATTLVIEFVPKTDSQVQRLLATREDIFPDYTEEAFAAAFSTWFDIESSAVVPGTVRTLFAMRRRR